MNIFSRQSILYTIYIVFFAYILLIFSPVIIFGITGGYDVIHHVSWYLSFRDEISFNNIYPRWFTTQYNGLGAPVLYFYPPFTNYFFYFVDSLTLFSIRLENLIGLCAFLLSLLSGAAFYFWARVYVSWHISIVFSFLYMVLPYHLLMNLYWRAAMAEFAAYLWMPLIFLSTYHVVQSLKARWILLLSLSVAGLFLTHVLSALIVGPVVAIYALLMIQDKYGLRTFIGLKKLITLSFYAAIGIGISAFYLIPALTLMDHISAEALYRKNIEDSYIYKVFFEEVHNHQARLRTSSIAIIYLVISLYLLFEFTRLKTKQTIKAQYFSGYWISVALGSFFLMCGFLGFLFQDPSPYRNIQFLTRLLLINEFAVVTAFMVMLANSSSSLLISKRCLLITGSLFLLLMTFQLYDVADRSRGIVQKAPLSQWKQVKMRMSPDEYFPVGFDYTMDPNGESFVLKNTSSSQLAFIISGNGELLMSSIDEEGFRVNVRAQTPVSVDLKQFYFPGWAAYDDKNKRIEVVKSSDNFFLSFDAPIGDHEIKVKRVLLPLEKIGLFISLASFVILCFSAFIIKTKISAK